MSTTNGMTNGTSSNTGSSQQKVVTFGEVAVQYAKALYQVVHEAGNDQKVLKDMRDLDRALESLGDGLKVLASPLLSAEEKSQTFLSAIEGKGLSEEVVTLVKILLQKNRIENLREIVAAYVEQSDVANGVLRGSVQAPTELSPAERTNIEELISEVTKKKVILEYKTTPQLIGGLFAKVGSYTFDDSIDTQLHLISDHLKRRSN
ncbi:MAG: ATP synthase F1 subunit delta [Bdellovibrionales bacterium]